MSTITKSELLDAVRHNPAMLKAVKAQLREPRTPVGDPECKSASVTVEMQLRAGPNARHSPWAKASRVKTERAAGAALLQSMRQIPALPVTVILTRYGKKAVDEHENLRGMFKAVVDGISDVYGVADNDPRYDWQYRQEVGKDRVPAIKVELVARAPAGG